MTGLRVAFVTHTAGLYGANRSLLTLTEGLREHGVEPRVLAPREGRVTEELSDAGVPFRVLPFKRWRNRSRRKAPLRLGANLLLLPAVAGQLRRWGADLVYSNSSVVPVGAWTAALLGLPHVWHVREFGRPDYGLRHDLGRRAFSFWLQRADAVIAVSEALRRHLRPALGGRDARVVYNGVVSRAEARRLRERARERGEASGAGGGSGGPYVFAIVGTLGGRKGQAEAVEALALAREEGVEARLRVVGSGPEEEAGRLRRRAAELGVGDAVTFTGYVEDPFEEYLAADAVLVCSPAEAMGRVTAEAMLACRPVIGYRGGATPELVADGETGLLYGDGGAELAGKMAALARDPERGRRMGREGWDRAYPELTTEAYCERVRRILAEVADGSSGEPKA